MRKRIERARVHAARNEIVPRAFRRRFAEARSFDFQKTVFGKIVSGDVRNLTSEHKKVLKIRTSEVEITILKPQAFAGVHVVLNEERRVLRFVQNSDVGGQNFHFAGLHVRVDVFAGSQLHDAGNRENVFVSDGFRFFEEVCVFRAVKRNLHKTGSVPQIDEDEVAEVSDFCGKAHDDHVFAFVFCGQVAAHVCSFQTVDKFCHRCIPLVKICKLKGFRGSLPRFRRKACF